MKRSLSHASTFAKSFLFLAVGALVGALSLNYLNARPTAPLYHAKPKDARMPQLQVTNYAPLVKRVKPAVFNLRITGRAPAADVRPMPPRGHGQMPFHFFFDQFGRQVPRHARPIPRRSSGSGFLINNQGYALTNNHVVTNAGKIVAQLEDGREFQVKIIGQSKLLDLALIKLQTSGSEKLPYAYLGRSSVLEVGEPVIAIGNARGLGLTVTTGIISAKGRMIGSGAYDNYIQTDAAINHGNSGGPLFNLKGEVIGINTAILRGGRGIGFAIPIDMVRQVLPQLRSKGRIERAQLGVMVQRMSPNLARSFGLALPQGALISQVLKGSPADRAGLKGGDVILKVDGVVVRNHNHLPRLIAFRAPGSKVKMELWRGKKKHTLTVSLTRWQDDGSPRKPQPRRAPSDDDDADAGGYDLSDLGVKVEPVDGNTRKQLGLRPGVGVRVRSLPSKSVAAQHGVRLGDVIISVNQTPVRSAKQLKLAIAKVPKGEHILLRIRRKNSALFLAIPKS